MPLAWWPLPGKEGVASAKDGIGSSFHRLGSLGAGSWVLGAPTPSFLGDTALSQEVPPGSHPKCCWLELRTVLREGAGEA